MKTTPSQPPRYFPIEVAAQLVGVKPAVLTYWQRHGFLKPAVPAHGVGPKNKRYYSFAQLVAVRILSNLTGSPWYMPLGRLQPALDYLSNQRDLSERSNPRRKLLVTDGESVREVEPTANLAKITKTLRQPHGFTVILRVEDVVRQLQPKAQAYLRAEERPTHLYRGFPIRTLRRAQSLHASGMSLRGIARKLELPWLRFYRAYSAYRTLGSRTTSRLAA